METKALLIDYEQGLGRFSGMETLYRKYLLKFPDDGTFAALRAAMDGGNYDEAFRCAHTLKGIAGNLSLAALNEAVQSFVELLRDGRDIPEAAVRWGALEEIYAETVKAVLARA